MRGLGRKKFNGIQIRLQVRVLNMVASLNSRSMVEEVLQAVSLFILNLLIIIKFDGLNFKKGGVPAGAGK